MYVYVRVVLDNFLSEGGTISGGGAFSTAARPYSVVYSQEAA